MDGVEVSTRRNDSLVATAFEHAPIGMALVSLQGAWVRVNEALCKLLGYSASELLATTLQQVTHPDDLEADLEQRSRLLAGEIDRYEMEIRYLKRFGAFVWGLLSVSLGRTAEGTPELLIAQIVDLTERNASQPAKIEGARAEVEVRRSTAALRESETRLRFAIEGSGDGLWDWDVPAGKAFFSTRYKEMLGYAEAEIGDGNEEWTSRIHPEDLSRVMAELQPHLDGVIPSFAVEHRVRCKDDSYKWILARGLVTSRDAAGKPLRMVGTHKDITARKHEEGERLRNLLIQQMMSSGSPMGYLVVDNRTDEIRFFNKRFCEIWGIEHLAGRMERGELKNQDIIPDCLPMLADAAAFTASCAPLQSEADRVVIDDEIPFTAGRTIRRYSTHLRGADDRYHGRFYLFEDITRYKQAERRQAAHIRTMAAMASLPLAELLATVVRGAEAELLDTLGSVLLLDEAGTHLLTGAAPSLPPFYNDAIHGVAIGPAVGSCGTAAFRMERVVVADIQTDPLWADYKELAARAGLAACWSEPILGRGGRLLGTFAFYFTTPRVPNEAELATIDAAAKLAAVAIERSRAEELLRTSNQLLEASQAIAKVGGWELDLVTKKLFWTAETYRLHDTSPTEFAPTVDAAVGYFLPESRRIISAALEAAMERGESYDLVLETLTTKGRWIDVRTTCEVTMHEGRPAKLTGIFQDITERKREERALTASKAQLRQLMQNLSVGIVVHGPDTRVLLHNQAALALLGLSGEQVLAKAADHPVWCFVREDHTPMPVGEYPVTRVVATRAPVRDLVLGILRPRTNDCAWVLVNAFPELASNGQIQQVVVTFADITTHKQAEDQLRLLSSCIAQLNDAIIITDTAPSSEGGPRIVFVNEAVERMTGYTRAEIIGQTPRLFQGPRTDPAELERVRTALRETQSIHVELVNYSKSGAEYWIEMALAPVLSASGGATHFVAIQRDITTRKAASAEREALQLQLQQSQKLDSIGQLAGGVAHDFNNMLSVILGTTDLALHAIPKDGELHADLLEIRTAAERSAALTRQLLAFARQEAIVPRSLDLNETIAGMLTMLRRLLGEDLAMTWTPGVNLGLVKMDPSQVDQLLANLCINARDAVTGVGTVAIRTANAALDQAQLQGDAAPVSGAFVCLSVSDNGSGMDASTLGRIFEPFFTTKARGKGTGLGLAMVYGIVKQNGGVLDVVSESGKGTTFSIYLPRDDSDSARPTQASPGLAPGGGETVLVVDDEPAILVLCKRFLTSKGYTVMTANTPREALTLAAEHSAELRLLITDVIMPEMTGRELSEQLTSLYPHVRCLFMSGYTADIIATRGVLEEGVAFMQKPFLTSELGAKVRSVLDTPGPAPPSSTSQGPRDQS